MTFTVDFEAKQQLTTILAIIAMLNPPPDSFPGLSHCLVSPVRAALTN